MDASAFAKHFPRLYHLTFASNLPSIHEHGLLSAQALADRYSFISGAFLYNPRPRGRDSFIPLAAYKYKVKRDTPAELSINAPIPEILRISTIAAEPHRAGV